MRNNAPPRLMPALVTPFDGGGEIVWEDHRHNLALLSELGIKGFLLGGSTGEGPLLEPGERAGLVAGARAELGKQSFLLVGIVAESVRQALGQIRELDQTGADGVLVLTPTTLARTSLDAQRQFFTSVADHSSLPVYLYSVPRNTGYALDEGLAVELAAHPRILGMKDSGGDAARIQRLAQAGGDGFLVFNGATSSLMLAVTGGAYGAVTASTNYLPRRMAELVETSLSRSPRANGLQAEVGAIAGAVERLGIGGVKSAANLIGLRAGGPRAPLAPVAAEAFEDAVVAYLQAAVTAPA